MSVIEKTRDEKIENPNKVFTEVRLIIRSTCKTTMYPHLDLFDFDAWFNEIIFNHL